MLQLIGLTALIGHIIFQGGRRATENVALQLLEETGHRVVQQIDTYLQLAERVNQNHVTAFQAGLLDTQRLEQLHRYLILELQQHDDLTSLLFTTPEGDARVVHRVEPERITPGSTQFTESELLIEAGLTTSGPSRELLLYSTDAAGNLNRLLETLKDFDIRRRPWYRQGAERGQSGWVEPFHSRVADLLVLNAYTPVYDASGALQGVFSANISLNKISEFLYYLEPSETGAIFIMAEQDGRLIADSVSRAAHIAPVAQSETDFSPRESQGLSRLAAAKSHNALIRQTARHLLSRFEAFNEIQTPQQVSIQIDNNQYFVQVTPYDRGRSLSWLIVTVVPEYRFIGGIYSSLHRMLAVSALILLGTITLCFWMARRITRPIVALNQNAQAFERGELAYQPDLTRVQEINSLQQTFYQMASRLRELLSNLERQVQQQTAELRRSEANLKEAQRIAMMGSWTLDVATETILWSDELLQIYGLQGAEPRPNCTKFLSHLPPDDRDVLKAAVEQAIATGQPYEVEHEFNHPDGKTLCVISRGEAVFDGQGRVVELVGTATDISDRKWAELQQQQYLRELAEWRNCYDMAARASGQVLFEYDWTMDEQRWGPNTEEVLGYPVDQLPADMGGYISLIYPEDRPAFEKMLAVCRNSSSVYRLEFRFLRPDDTYIWVEERGATRFDTMGRAIQQIGYISNISEQKRLERELVKTRDFKELLFNESTDALFLVDVVTRRILDCNQRAVELFGVSRKNDLIDVEGHTLQKRQLTPAERNAAWQQLIQRGFWATETEYVTPSGREFWGDLSAKLIEFGGQQFNLVRVTDISDRKRAELALQSQNAELEKLATVDSLTQVANRRQLEATLHREWHWHQQTQCPLTLIMLDIDHFKTFNDRYGHPAGDVCLHRVAQALQSVVNRPKDLVARYGGEEFTLLLPDTDYSGAVSIAQQIQQAVAALAIANPTHSGQSLTVSMGAVAVYISDQLTLKHALARADEALYQAKQARNTYCIEQLGFKTHFEDRTS